MAEFVDLHCHFIPGVDDGVKSFEEARDLLLGLAGLGFGHVTATPHTRPGMFDNDRAGLIVAYENFLASFSDTGKLPRISLASEHFFCEVFLERALRGEVLPYRLDGDAPRAREKGALLVEFHDLTPQAVVEQQLFRLQTLGYIPVIAHPERYRAVWQDVSRLARLVELGSYALLDLGALVGKYGREAERCSKRLLEDGIYHAACSDAHRPKDLAEVESGMRYIEKTYGREELEFLLGSSTSALLRGEKPLENS